MDTMRESLCAASQRHLSHFLVAKMPPLVNVLNRKIQIPITHYYIIMYNIFISSFCFSHPHSPPFTVSPPFHSQSPPIQTSDSVAAKLMRARAVSTAMAGWWYSWSHGVVGSWGTHSFCWEKSIIALNIFMLECQDDSRMALGTGPQRGSASIEDSQFSRNESGRSG